MILMRFDPFFYGYVTTFNWNCTPKCIKQVYQTMLSTSTSFLRIPSLCGKHTLPRQQGNKWIAKGPETISMLTLKPGSNGSTVDTYIYIYQQLDPCCRYQFKLAPLQTSINHAANACDVPPQNIFDLGGRNQCNLHKF